jgi:hypothetical protein
MFDAFHGEQELIWVRLRASAEFPPVVRMDRAQLDPEGVVERQYAVVEQVAGGDGHLRDVDLGERDRAEDVDQYLDGPCLHPSACPRRTGPD